MNKLNYFGIMLVGIINLTFISGCQKEESMQSEEGVTHSVVETDGFLSFEGNLIEPEVIWENIEVYSQAYDRMAKHLLFGDNKISWDCGSAEEANVSQNIYDYIISGWRQDSIKLATGDYKLEVDGIYYSVMPKEIPMMTKSGAFIMRANQHDKNMKHCISMVKGDCMGWLGKYIDLKNSDFTPDSYGGKLIKGVLTSAVPHWGYAVFLTNPKDLDDELNYICGSRSDGNMNYLYQKLINKQHAPLVTVLNAHLYKR